MVCGIDMKTIEFYATKLTQPIGEFFVGVLPADVVRRTAAPEPRKLVDLKDETNEGIQRTLSERRVGEIREYLATVDASFPNSIILNLAENSLVDGPTPVFLDGQDRRLYKFTVLDGGDSFSVIDGQHRLKGFDDETSKNFELVVTIFLGLEEEEKAYLFSTINSTQTKVSKSLVYDLFDVAETRSPQRTAHLVAKGMNSDEKSPFYRRIKLLGTNPKVGDQLLYKANLSQGTVVERLLDLMTADAATDRDAVKRGQLPHFDAKAHSALVFRKLWIDEEDAIIMRVMTNYFKAISVIFKTEWNDIKSPLAKTIGFGAFMRLLPIFFRIGEKEKDLSENFFRSCINRIYLNYIKSGVEINFSNFPAAGNGETKLFKQLFEWADLKE
jgi:DGQHR domain-containing protein